MSLLMLFPYAGLILLWRNWQQSSVSSAIIFGSSLLITLLYLSALGGVLLPVVVLLMVIGIAGLLKNLRTLLSKSHFESNLPLWLLILFASVFWGVHSASPYTHFDEFAHWGIHVRELWAFGALWTNDSNSMHPGYPPATALWQYFFTVFGSRSEGGVYLAHFILLMAPLMVIFELRGKAKFFWIAVLVVLLITLLANYSSGITSIYADHMLSVWFAGAVLQYFREYQQGQIKQLWIYLLPVVALLLIKNAGLILAGFLVGIIALLEWFRNHGLSWQQQLRKLSLWGVASLVVILLTTYSWSINRGEQTLSEDQYSSQNVVTGILSGTSSLSEVESQALSQRFLETLYLVQISRDDKSRLANEYSWFMRDFFQNTGRLSTMGMILVCLVIQLIIIFFIADPERRKSISLLYFLTDLSVAVFLYILFLSYHFAFGGAALALPSIIRFIHTILLPLMLITVAPLFTAYDSSRRAQALLVILLVALLAYETPYLKPMLYPVDNKEIAGVLEIRKSLQKAIRRLPDESRQAKLMVYAPEVIDSGILARIIYYELAPTRVTMNTDKQLLLTDISQLKASWSEYNYVWMPITFEDDFKMTPEFRELLKQSNLFKVNRAGDDIALKPVVM